MVIPGVAIAARCDVQGEGVRRAVLRQPARFTITAVDALGSLVTRGGENFVLAVRGPDSARRTLVDAGNGTYHAAWIPTVSGSYAVSVTLNGEHVAASPYMVIASVPRASAAHSVVHGAGLHSTVAGELTSFDVSFSDKHGSPAAAEDLVLELEALPHFKRSTEPPPMGGLIFCGVAGGSDGQQTASYSVRRAGDYELSVKLRESGGALPGSPFALRVRPAPAFAASCEILLPTEREGAAAADTTDDGALVCVAGERRRLRVRVADRWGNACEAGAADELLRVDGGGGVRSEARAAPEDGYYDLVFVAEARGEQQLGVLIDGEHVRGSPLRLRVQPGRLDAGSCEVECGPRSLRAGELLELHVACRDARRNPLKAAEAGRPIFGVALFEEEGPASGGGADQVAVSAEGDADPGRWAGDRCTVALRTAQAGSWLAHGWCEAAGGAREALPGSPWAVVVTAAAPDARLSRIESCSHELRAGEPLQCTVQLRDRFGNACAAPPHPSSSTSSFGPLSSEAPAAAVISAADSKPAANDGGPGAANGLRAALRAPDGTVRALPLQSAADGRQQLHQALSGAGVHSLELSLRGTQLAGSPLSIAVVPGAACGGRSRLEPPATPVEVGRVARFSLLAHDRWGNRLTAGGASVSARVQGPGGVSCEVCDLGDGSYAISVRPDCSGPCRLVVMVNGQPPQASPLPFVVGTAPALAVAALGSRTARTPRGGGPGAASAATTVALASPKSGRRVSAHARVTAAAAASAASDATAAASAATAASAASASSPCLALRSPRRTPSSPRPVSSSPRIVGGGVASPRRTAVAPSSPSPASPSPSPARTPRFASPASCARASRPSSAPPPRTPAAAATAAAPNSYAATAATAITAATASTAAPPKARPSPASTRSRSAVVKSPSAMSPPARSPPPPSPGGGIGRWATTSAATAVAAGAPPMASPRSPGSKKREAWVGGPIVAPLVGGVAAASQSWLSGPAEALPGEPTRLLVTACDGLGQPLPPMAELPPFVAAVRGPSHAGLEMREVKGGEVMTGGDVAGGEGGVEGGGGGGGGCCCELTMRAPAVSGEYLVSVTLGGEHVRGSPHTLTVLAPGLRVERCIARGEALKFAVAGEHMRFGLEARDAHGRSLSFGGERFEVVLHPAAATGGEADAATLLATGDDELNEIWDDEAPRVAVHGTVRDRRDGTYECSYRALRSGHYMLSVACRRTGAAVSGSPFALLVAPADPHPAACELRGDGLHEATAGQEARLTLVSRDMHGNRQLYAAHEWRIVLAGPAALAASLRQLRGGAWEGRYRPTVAGRYQLSVTLAGEHTRGSPFEVLVSPGPLDPRRCVVEAPPRAQRRNTPIQFRVLPSDAHGNPTSYRGARWSARVRPPLTSGGGPPVRLRGNADGTCEGSFTPLARGRHTLVVLLDGQAIPNGGEVPFEVQ